MPISVKAGGFPVYSAVEHSQSILTHVEVLQDAIVQLDNLGINTDTLLNQMESLVLQYEQFDQHVRNAQRLYRDFEFIEDANLNEILETISRIEGRIKDLDPRNPFFDDVAKENIHEEYGDPTVRASQTHTGDQSIINNFDQRGADIQQGYEEYQEYLKFRAIQNQKAIKREDEITQFRKDLNSLGDDSELATQQLTAYQINLLLTQQEEMKGSIDQINDREERREQKQRARELEAYQDKIETWERKANTVWRSE